MKGIDFLFAKAFLLGVGSRVFFLSKTPECFVYVH